MNLIVVYIHNSNGELILEVDLPARVCKKTQLFGAMPFAVGHILEFDEVRAKIDKIGWLIEGQVNEISTCFVYATVIERYSEVRNSG